MFYKKKSANNLCSFTKNVYTGIPLDGLLSIYISVIYVFYFQIKVQKRESHSLSPLASPFISIASGHYIHM